VREKAQDLRLFDQDGPAKNRLEIVGHKLYETAFGSEEIRRLLYHLLQPEDEIPVLEIHIPDVGSILQAYPWELLYDHQGFLFKAKRAFLVRHVDFEGSVPQVKLTEALRVLYVAPRPDVLPEGYQRLPVLEKVHLEDLNLRYPDHLALEHLPANAFGTLHGYLMDHPTNPPHIVHIDTHGGFGWLCEECKTLNFPPAKRCSSCKKSRSSDQKDQGCLAFEADDGKLEWVSGARLSELLYRRGIPVLVLSACKSGLVAGSSTFNSVAGALVKQRIPAVVAMQFSVGVEQADKFVEFFYKALANRVPLTEAVAEARQALSDDSWYRPVLYLRTDPDNYRGKVFRSPNPQAQELWEWKLIHHECQELIGILRGGPLDHLDDCLKETDTQKRHDKLDKACKSWIQDCVPRLGNIPGRWNLRHAQVAEIARLGELAPKVQLISKHLAKIDPLDGDFRVRFWEVYDCVLEFYGVLWKLLGIADREIRRLVETLHPEDIIL
jgi:hypothetical protein